MRISSIQVFAMTMLLLATQAPASSTISFQVFYNDLAAYGQWIDYPPYGYVWRPHAEPGFVPYCSNGHWIYSDYGWTWVSNYDWGWAPFHYGRWNVDPELGWYWVPGYEWAPAWVAWRRCPGYFGWVPLAPGVSLTLSFSWATGVPENRWVFIRDRDFESQRVYTYRIDPRRNAGIIRQSQILSRTYTDRNRNAAYFSGPDRKDVQRVTGRPVRQVWLHDYNRPARPSLRGNQLNMYRPSVQRYREQKAPLPPGGLTIDQYRAHNRYGRYSAVPSPSNPRYRKGDATEMHPATPYRQREYQKPRPNGPAAAPPIRQPHYQPGSHGAQQPITGRPHNYQPVRPPVTHGPATDPGSRYQQGTQRHGGPAQSPEGSHPATGQYHEDGRGYGR